MGQPSFGKENKISLDKDLKFFSIIVMGMNSVRKLGQYGFLNLRQSTMTTAIRNNSAHPANNSPFMVGGINPIKLAYFGVLAYGVFYFLRSAVIPIIPPTYTKPLTTKPEHMKDWTVENEYPKGQLWWKVD